MDKLFSKKVLSELLDSDPCILRLMSRGGAVKGVKLPYVVKPGSQGSAIGVTVVRKKSQLARAAIKMPESHTVLQGCW